MARKFLSVPVALQEAQLEAAFAAAGKCNSGVFPLDGHEYAPAYLRLIGFAGGLNPKTKLYEGEYRFEPGNFDLKEPAADFKALPGFAAAKPELPKPAPAPVKKDEPAARKAEEK